MEERQEDRNAQDVPSADPLESMQREPAFRPNIGVSNPGSPGDLTGANPLPESGGVGAGDPASGTDVSSDQPPEVRGNADEMEGGEQEQVLPM
jgi:hypothetical protein